MSIKLGLILPATNANVEATNDVIFLWSEISMLYVGSQVVQPSQPTALATSL
jgi:hypothetical protein